MKKILSIDDEPMVLKCLEKMLHSRGYEIVTTNNPNEGIKILQSDNSFDLLLLDVMMPEVNGFEFYKTIRKTNPIPTLFITAFPKSFNTDSDEIVEMWEKSFSDGSTDIIYKPLRLEDLIEKVEALIGESND
jgi:CheY-like chemotaxis protein